jgi:S-adenosylmethionine synthetase
VDDKIVEISGYDLSPQGIYNFLDLGSVKWADTANWGHFGRNFSWK